MPHLGFGRFHPDAIDALNHLEHAAQYDRLGEVLFDLLVGEGVAVLAQLLRGPGYVPGLQRIQPQFGLGEGRQLGHIGAPEG
jgi:hypothetical protein